MWHPGQCSEQTNEIYDDYDNDLSTSEILKGVTKQNAGNQSIHVKAFLSSCNELYSVLDAMKEVCLILLLYYLRKV